MTTTPEPRSLADHPEPPDGSKVFVEEPDGEWTVIKRDDARAERDARENCCSDPDARWFDEEDRAQADDGLTWGRWLKPATGYYVLDPEHHIYVVREKPAGEACEG